MTRLDYIRVEDLKRRGSGRPGDCLAEDGIADVDGGREDVEGRDAGGRHDGGLVTGHYEQREQDGENTPRNNLQK